MGRMADFRDMRYAALGKHLRRYADAEVRFDDTSRRLYATDASIYQMVPEGVERLFVSDKQTAEIALRVNVACIQRMIGIMQLLP